MASEVVKVSKWGNSLGVRLPKSFASKRAIVEGSLVRIDSLKLIEPPKARRRSRYKLKDLLAESGRSPMGEVALGPAVGRKVL